MNKVKIIPNSRKIRLKQKKYFNNISITFICNI